VGKGVVLPRLLVEPTVVERAVVPGLAVVVAADVGVLAGGIERAVVESFVDPQAATPRASTTAAVVR
jgi:hypothetical protein